MELNFKPITEGNAKEAKLLRVGPGQEGFVEDVSQCLEEAKSRRSWRPVGIYDGPVLVGFSMYGYFWEYLPFGRVWLDRLLIDEKYQGMGYGKASMDGLIRRISKEYGCRKIYLSVYENNQTAVKLYKKLGFQAIAERDIHGEQVMVLHLAKYSL